MLKTFCFKATVTGNDMMEPMPFNLIVKTDVGTNRDLSAILRHETAQGIFLTSSAPWSSIAAWPLHCDANWLDLPG